MNMFHGVHYCKKIQVLYKPKTQYHFGECPHGLFLVLYFILNTLMSIHWVPTYSMEMAVEEARTLAETKIGRLVYSNSLSGGTDVIRILRFFVALCLSFLPSHRYRTKQNRSYKLLLNVRMQYDCLTQCQKRIKSLIFFKVGVLLAELYVK
jgi:hypothetical protein